MPVSFSDIVLAYEFVSMGGMGEHRAVLCKQSGKIYYQSECSDLDELPDDELPDDIENDEKYLPIPDKRELNLGKQLALAFAGELLPNDLDDVRRMFSRRGAYAQFKSLLADRRALDRSTTSKRPW